MVNAKRGTMRRVSQIVAAAGLVLLVGKAALAAPDARDLKWQQLIPVDSAGMLSSDSLRGVIQHGQVAAIDPVLATIAGNDPQSEAQSTGTGRKASRRISSEVVPELNGERVRMRGFVVPVGFDGTKVKEFLLVPYVGACIHVPPPPANQIVLIEAATPFEIGGMFEAVAVTGTMRTEAMSNEIASFGYQIAAAQVERIAADK